VLNVRPLTVTDTFPELNQACPSTAIWKPAGIPAGGGGRSSDSVLDVSVLLLLRMLLLLAPPPAAAVGSAAAVVVATNNAVTCAAHIDGRFFIMCRRARSATAAYY
jgi:hypothetical protein